MAGKSDFLENELLDHVLRNSAYTPPAAVYVGLYTAAPTDAGGGTEVSGNAYARQPITFGAASGGAVTNSADITFPTPTPSGWGTVTHFGIFDASTAGNLLYWGALAASQTINASNVVKILTGELDVTED
jgi:hypothetical protein